MSIEEKERELEMREKIVEQKEEVLFNIWENLITIKESIHKILDIFDNNVSDDLHEMKSLLSELYFPNLRHIKNKINSRIYGL